MPDRIFGDLKISDLCLNKNGGYNVDWDGKKVLVCGIAKSGISAAYLLKSLGADTTISDIKERDKIEKEAAALENANIKLFLGKNPDEIVNEFDLIIISPGIPYDLPFLNKARDAGIKVWGEIELASRVCKSPIIAITGTNGKTTTTALTGEILKTYKPDTFVAGNIGIPFCNKAGQTSDDGFAVAEISSFQLETIESFKPRISAILNITPDHLNRHKTMENYADIKANIFKNQTGSDFVVLNYDDEYCRRMGVKTNAKVLFFSRKQELAEGVFLTGSDIYVKWKGYDGILLNKDELLIFGNHNIENIMASIGIALCSGVPFDIIKDVLKKFKGVEHRIEYVRTLDGVDFYNDSKATNVDAAIKAIEAMDKPIILIGGGRDKTGDFSEWVKLFQENVKCLIAIGEAADLIIETCKAYNFMNFHKANSMKDAVDISFSNAVDGDCVVLSPACASFDMFDSYEQRGNIFKEFVLGLSIRGEH